MSNATYRIEIDCGFTKAECKELFSKVLNQEMLPDEAVDLHRLCKQNPFVISVIAFNIKTYKSNLTRWRYWKTLLEKNESLNHEDIRKPIEVSLTDLKHKKNSLYQYFEKLVIFKDNVNIPIKVT